MVMYVVLIECLNGSLRNSRLTLSNENVAVMYRLHIIYSTTPLLISKQNVSRTKENHRQRTKPEFHEEKIHRTQNSYLSNIQLKEMKH